MKILHIEDQEFFINSVKKLLVKNKEIELENSNSIIDATKKLSTKRYNLIILDGNLIDGKSDILLDIILQSIDPSKILLHSGTMSFLMLGKSKGINNLFLKNDQEVLFAEILRNTKY